jgi:hypothetical protein
MDSYLCNLNSFGLTYDIIDGYTLKDDFGFVVNGDYLMEEPTGIAFNGVLFKPATSYQGYDKIMPRDRTGT